MPIDRDVMAKYVAEGFTLTRIAEESGYGLTTIRYWADKYGLRTTKNRRSWTDDQLVMAIKDATTISDVVRALGLKTTAAGNWSTIYHHVKRLDLDTSHLLGRAHGKGGIRVTDEEVLIEDSPYRTANLKKRLLVNGSKILMCERCWLTDWQGEPIAIEVDHVNGVPTDHRIENLRFLCPNCHAMTPTWRGRNNKQG